MKYFLLMMFTALVTLLVNLNGGADPRKDDDRYCAKLRDGKLVMMHEGSILTADVTLTNGTQIKVDGSVIKPDGGTIALKDGECVDKDGVSEEKKPKRK